MPRRTATRNAGRKIRKGTTTRRKTVTRPEATDDTAVSPLMPGASPEHAKAAEEALGSPGAATRRDWLNPSDASSYLSVSRPTLYKLMHDGLLPYYTIKGIRKRRLKKEDLDALMEKGVPDAEEDEKDD